ncbi:amidohydrolase family protein [Adhaeribacter rhizoryzae]|uniref:Amidohydrolase-related domain-containing protein n=1 Tax=Adhaeribacter rhizoryzae TaxID=2607907 RepID=A0A5M6CWL8_9BACT|nr:hypothetical protein [Adhaeribacter rhizoryzae]KAA5539366.1 hypothetical protein F0145_24495 [Adhaeribacter rhizoryzae]
MKENKQVYADISVISNPDILPPEKFSVIMKAFLDAELADCLMFGTDNGDIAKVISAVESLTFMSKKQKKKVYYQNAEQFFGRIKKLNYYETTSHVFALPGQL